MFKRFLTNWHTTAGGVLAGLAMLMPHLEALTDNDPSTVADWNVIVAALGIIFAGLFARDANKTSQDNEVRP